MPYAQITRAQFRQLIKNQLGLAASVFWRDDELNQIGQEALRMFNLLTGYWKTRVTILTTVTTGIPDAWYVLPNTVNSNMRVSWQGFALTPTSLFDLDFGRPAWESETTTSGGDVPTRPTLFGIGALNLIAIWPADNAGGTVMTIDGLQSTPILANDIDLLNVGQEEMTGILDLCQLLAVFKEGGKEFSAAQEQFKTFLKAAGERNSMLRASATWRKYMGMDKSKSSRSYRLTDEKTGAR